MKIDNISIILTTKNCLPYLQAALKSIDEHATIVNDVIIWNDGSTDGTNEYLDNVQEFNFDVQVLNNNEIGKGLCTATNESFKVAKNEWVFLMHDDMIAGPNFDTNLTSCVKNINSVISNKCIEPGLIPVSKQFIEFNCGGTIDEFDNEKFLTKIKEIQDEKPDCTMDEIGYPILISKTLFENIGGLDEIFNTGPLNDPDFFYRIYIKSKEEGSDINLIRSSDAILYHFSGKATRFRGDDKKKDDSWGLVEESNYKAFIKKWGESPKYQFGSAINTELRKPIDSKELGLVILMKNNIDLLIQNSFDIYSYFFDEIVIIDDMSDNADEMSEILSKYKNVTVYKRSLDNDFGEQRNYAASKLHTKWVFHLDADETFESKLIESLRGIIRTLPENIDVVGFPRMNYVDRKQTEVYPDIQYRLHRRGIKWINKVHEHPTLIGGHYGTAPAHIIHIKSTEQFNKQQDFYDNIEKGAGSKRL